MLENVKRALVAPLGMAPDAPRFLMSKPSMLRSAGVRVCTDWPFAPLALSKKFEPGESAVASCVLPSRV
ncbi:hypothetical protein [Cellulosimicrobium funkei]|uniref:hypothetical protein n=1 Tax=Cellulosimicrobium funkei TaxID=264251 RepID=UPI003442BFAF